MQQALETAISKVKYSSIQLQSKQLERYTGTGTKTHRTKAPETNCKVLLDLKYFTWINYT